jgi:hypothetical protein
MVMMRMIMEPMSAPEGGMMPMIIGSLIGHIMYGISVALIGNHNNNHFIAR